MSTNEPPQWTKGQDGLGFAQVMRECLVCGVICIDAEWQTASLNPEAGHLLGWRAAQLPKSPVTNLPAPLRQIAEEVRSSGTAASPRLIQLMVASPEPSLLRVTAVPVVPGQVGTGVVLVLNDLAAGQQMEHSLYRLDRLASLGTLAAAMAHEIKNALVAGKTFMDLLLERNKDSEMAAIVKRELNRIDVMVSRMVKSASPARPALAAVKLHESLDLSLMLVEPMREGKAIDLNRSFQAASDVIHGDDYELQQAFVNLLLNALEAMPPHGVLTVTTETLASNGAPSAAPHGSVGLKIRLKIQDTGPGIPPEEMPRLFEPFFTTKPLGTGLGLPITRHIIEEHGGNITVQSEPGQGATFQIVLPIVGDKREE
jgi:signal transduction histidine kinase